MKKLSAVIEMARPKKEIDQVEFEKLCGIQCTKDEICDWFDVTDKTLDGWCKRTYAEGFSATYAKKRGKGKISLRRMQFELAKKNTAMAIWLGKQYLGQREKSEHFFSEGQFVDALSDSLRELSAEMERE